jgi:DNA polymerase III sliding clamp (beta) subunit (PCNA family)
MHTLVDTHAFIGALLAPEPTEVDARTDAPPVSFTADYPVIATALERAAVVVPTGDAMPVLRNFQIRVDADRLRIIATDTQLSMLVSAHTVATEPGTFVLPAKRTLEIIKEADGDTVRLVVRAGVASITIGRTTWRLRLPGGADYPPMPDLTEVTLTPVDRAALATALHTVRYAAGRDAGKPALMQVAVNRGCFTASDGTRFQQATIATELGTFAVPVAAVDDLLKLLRGSDAPEITIGETARHLVFGFGADILIVTRLTAAFPDMASLLLRPALENTRPLTVARADLLAAVKRVRITADPQTLAVGLTVADGGIVVRARDEHGNDATESLPAGWAGGAHTVVVNHTSLTDMISACPESTLHFFLGEDTTTRKAPLLLTHTGTGAVGVVQQMHIDWSRP